MTKQSRNVAVLLGLLVLFAGIVSYQMWPASTATTGPAPSNPKGASAATAATSTQDVADVRLDRLQPGADAFAVPKRDPFRYRPKPPPPRPPAPPPVAPRPVVQNVPPAPPPPRPIPLKFIGYMAMPSGTRVAVLSDGTTHPPVTGKQGDVIDGQYRLLRVDPEEIEMAYLDGTGRRRIPKTGQ